MPQLSPKYNALLKPHLLAVNHQQGTRFNLQTMELILAGFDYELGQYRACFDLREEEQGIRLYLLTEQDVAHWVVPEALPANNRVASFHVYVGRIPSPHLEDLTQEAIKTILLAGGELIETPKSKHALFDGPPQLFLADHQGTIFTDENNQPLQVNI